MLARTGRDGLQRCAAEEGQLHVASKDVERQKPAPAFDSVERRVPLHGFAHARHAADDQRVEPPAEVALPTGHCGDVRLHRRVTLSFRNLGVAAREQNDFLGRSLARRAHACRAFRLRLRLGASRAATHRFLHEPFAEELRATAALKSSWNAAASTLSPSWMSIARRVLPCKLELKRCDGSETAAPWANVSFTTFWYTSPVHTIPSCDQTGTSHFHSSSTAASASRISARIRASVSPRHPATSTIRWSMSSEAGCPVATTVGRGFGGGASAFAAIFLAPDLRAPRAGDARLAF